MLRWLHARLERFCIRKFRAGGVRFRIASIIEFRLRNFLYRKPTDSRGTSHE